MAELKVKCMQLSCKVLDLGKGINSRRTAQVIYAELNQAVTELGAGARSIDYLPARSMRMQQAIDLIKTCQKVIYILRVAQDNKVFPAGGVDDALKIAVDIANRITETVKEYDPRNSVAPKAEGPVQQSAVPQKTAAAPEERKQVAGAKPEYKGDDPDGFNQPYAGKI